MARKLMIRDLNHTGLIEDVSIESGYDKTVVAAVLRAMFDVVGRTVAGGRKVTVTNFGSWYARRIPARPYRNPQTGETWIGEPVTRPYFRWSPAVKDATVSGRSPETFQKKASRHG